MNLASNISWRKYKALYLDFDGVLTDNSVITDSNGVEYVTCSRSDSLGLNLLKSRGIYIHVVSKERNDAVKMRCLKLGLPLSQAIDDKVSEIKMLSERIGIPLSESIYIGNDVNDLEAMGIVGLSVGVADAHASIMTSANYITKAYGGRGAVREICDFLLGE